MKGILSEETHWGKSRQNSHGQILDTDGNRLHFQVNPSQMHTIMDVGAEAGRFSLLAIDNNATVIGIDIDSYGLKRLKLKTKRVNVIQAGAKKIPLKNEAFGAIFMIEVLD